MSGDAETQRLLGALNANVTSLIERQDRMEKKLDSVVAMTNRWKGATTILIVLGGIIGWAGNFVLRFLPSNHSG